MSRNKILQVAFIIDDLTMKQRKRIKRYTYLNNTLVVFFEDGKHTAYSII